MHDKIDKPTRSASKDSADSVRLHIETLDPYLHIGFKEMIDRTGLLSTLI